MPEFVQRTSAAIPSASGATSGHGLLAGWREGIGIVDLRGNPADEAFCAAASAALGMGLPLRACTVMANATLTVVWAGPDHWFVLAPPGESATITLRLRKALAGMHHAATDVSSGYTVLHLGGPAARSVLAQGCPLDLHKRAFQPGASAGSHFFKASIWLWQTDMLPSFELLVRRSYMGYVWLMLERCTQECGLVMRRFV